MSASTSRQSPPFGLKSETHSNRTGNTVIPAPATAEITSGRTPECCRQKVRVGALRSLHPSSSRRRGTRRCVKRIAGRDPDKAQRHDLIGSTETVQFGAEQCDRPCRLNCPVFYILASCRNGTLYVGVTSNIYARMAQHAQKLVPGFTARYGVTHLVYFERHDTMEHAIRREKQIKEWRRLWKLRLIENMNPGWIDLFDAKSGEVLEGPFDAGLRSP